VYLNSTRNVPNHVDKTDLVRRPPPGTGNHAPVRGLARREQRRPTDPHGSGPAAAVTQRSGRARAPLWRCGRS